MNKIFALLVSLSVVLGSFGFAAPRALACGGGYGEYTRVDPDVASISARSLAFAVAKVGRAHTDLAVGGVEVDGDRATASVYAGAAVVLRVRLARSENGWRVSRWRRVYRTSTSA